MASTLPQPSDCCSACTTNSVSVTLGNAVATNVLDAVDTIAALRAVTSPTTADRWTINALGDAALGDFGGGHYYWDSTSTDADDGVATIKPNDKTALEAGRWKKVSLG